MDKLLAPLWIIAICTLIRVAQNAIQLSSVAKRDRCYEDATDEFIKSLKKSDKDFVKDLYEALERQEKDGTN